MRNLTKLLTDQLTTPEAVVLAFLLTVLASPVWAQGTYTAASCNRDDVNAVINGPTHTAVNGDVIQIPDGSCSWTSGITVPTRIGITVKGSGTPNSTADTFGASASCTNTKITLTGATAFTFTPSYGTNSRVSCMSITYGSGANIGISALGTCTSSGCPNLRVDNLAFTNWAGHTDAGISYGINVIGDLFGVWDHNTVSGTANTYLQLVEFNHARYRGVGLWGDNSWALPENYGSANFLFIENNVFNTSGCCENEAQPGVLENRGGGRVVVRFNHFLNMDNLNLSMGWHGTESNGRPRGTRAFEYYGNTFGCSVHCDAAAGARSGTGLIWGNSVDLSAGNLNSFFTFGTYRTFGKFSPWGPCDGSSAYDTNDGITYYAGTISAVTTGVAWMTDRITVSGASPGWTTDQWAVDGAPHSIHLTSGTNSGQGLEIKGNTANTLDVSQGWRGSLVGVGDSFQILRATACIDQGGGRGAGIPYDSTQPATPTGPANQVLSPSYIWANSFRPSFGKPASGVWANTRRVRRSRDFYVEDTNQAAQSNASSPFNGTNSIGMGHGTLANRPTTCTTGVGYWATDQASWNQSGSGGQGQLYVCTSPNTWTLYYTPYTYPHPLTTNETGVVGSVLPPTSLNMTVQ